MKTAKVDSFCVRVTTIGGQSVWFNLTKTQARRVMRLAVFHGEKAELIPDPRTTSERGETR